MDPFDPRGAALHADLDQVLTAAALWARGKRHRATFEVSFRSLPPDRGFILAAGIEQVTQYLLDFELTLPQHHFVRNLFVLHAIKPEPWDYLRDLRFTGDLDAAPEGTPIFPGEPFLRLTAPLPDALMLESYITSTLAYQSLVATKTARMVAAARGREIVDAGGGLGPGAAAAPLAARAAYIAGAAGTTNLEAGHRLGVPIHGRMTAAMVLACDTEDEAFRLHQEQCPLSPTLLLDVSDPLRAARAAIEPGRPLRAVRIDSGDRAALSKDLRRMLDEGGRSDVKIVVGGELDEHIITELVEAQAPIDVFWVGSALNTSADAPRLDLRFDLVALEKDGVMCPHGRAGAAPGVKQVFRRFASDGAAKGDTVALASEKLSGAPVLHELLRAGAASVGRPGLETIRSYTAQATARLPAGVRKLRDAEAYSVILSDELTALPASKPPEPTL